MNRIIIGFLIAFSIISCKNKKIKPEVPAVNFFPVNDYLKGQIAKMDTSSYSFLKIETANGRSDTTPIRNAEVKKYAKDFLELPDISSKEVKDDYEINHLYDEELEAFAFTFTTKEDHPIKSEHVVLEPMPNAEGKNDIRSIFIDLWQTKGDSSIRKNMLWEAAKSFQITTTTDLSGGTQTIKRVRIIWNGFDSQNK
jgi:hypothetical protein